MRPLRVVAALLALLLLAIPTVVLARAATAPAFAFSGLDGDDCPVVAGAAVTRCLSILQAANLAGVVVGAVMGFVGLLRSNALLARIGAVVLLAVVALGLAARLALQLFLLDDLFALAPVAVVAVVVGLAARGMGEASSPASA